MNHTNYLSRWEMKTKHSYIIKPVNCCYQKIWTCLTFTRNNFHDSCNLFLLHSRPQASLSLSIYPSLPQVADQTDMESWKKYRNQILITSSGNNEFHSLSSKVMFYLQVAGGTMLQLAYFAKWLIWMQKFFHTCFFLLLFSYLIRPLSVFCNSIQFMPNFKKIRHFSMLHNL
jgi:hypothetical protein